MIKHDGKKCKITKTFIKGLVVIEQEVFTDKRGFFMETYNKKSFLDNNISIEFVQDNHSSSSKGVLRGLHFQKKTSTNKVGQGNCW